MQSARTNQKGVKWKSCVGHQPGPSRIAGMIVKTCGFIIALMAVLSVGAIENRIAVPRLLTNGDLSISYAGFAAHNYALERADSLIPPITWVSLLTNTAD